MIRLNLREVTDRFAQENFRILDEANRDNPLLKNRLALVDETFTANGANLKIPHGLGFQPRDLLQTFKSGSGTITWNYDRFTSTELDVTITGASETAPLKVRALIGTFS